MEALSYFKKVAAEPRVALDLIRVYLGIGLLVRGVMFVAHPEVLLAYVKTGDHGFLPLAVTHYVAAAHLCGGILLALGLGTRIAALLQVPALLGAVFFVHLQDGLLATGQSLEFSALVLLMLVVYSVYGAGGLSLDALLEQGPEADPAPDSARSAPIWRTIER